MASKLLLFVTALPVTYAAVLLAGRCEPSVQVPPYDAVLSIQIADKCGPDLSVVGTVYLSPPMVVKKGFQGIEAGTLVRPMAFHTSYFYGLGKSWVGTCSAFQNWREGSADPYHCNATRRVPKETGETAVFTELELAPVVEGGWINVRSRNDLLIRHAASDDPSQPLRKPTPAGDGNK